MERLFIKKLEEWKTSTNRKPLIIRGARQVGKTFLIKEFGRKSFRGNIHVVDFEKHTDWRGIFEKNLDPVRILSELEILLNTKIEAGNDLLFFDEIQTVPRALMSLRYFYEEMPELHVVSAGSLIDFVLKEISFPVGRVNIKDIHPLNFYEFLLASGKEKAAELLQSVPEKLPDSIHSLLLESLREYFFIGGMPECVNVWVNTKSLARVFECQSDLLESYRQDFSKYTPYVDKRNLNQTLNMIAKSIGHQIKYTHLSDEFTGPTNKKSFEVLNLAGVIHKVRASSAASLPLATNASDKKFKAIMVDIGLMRAINQAPANLEYMKNDLLAMYNGAMAEQFAGQELLARDGESVFYWSRNARSSTAEVDYLISGNNKIMPIEIKSGKAGRLKSLHLLLKENPHIGQGYILSTASYGKIIEQKLTFLPLYYAGGIGEY